MAVKKYIVTSSGVKKETGELYCWATAIEKTKHGSWLSQNDRIQLSEQHPVGTIFDMECTIKMPASASAPAR